MNSVSLHTSANYSTYMNKVVEEDNRQTNQSYSDIVDILFDEYNEEQTTFCLSDMRRMYIQKNIEEYNV